MNRMTIHEFTATLDEDTTPVEPTAITHHETIVGWYIPTPTNPQQQPTHTHVDLTTGMDTEDHTNVETSGPTTSG